MFPYLKSNQLLLFFHDTLNMRMTLGFEKSAHPSDRLPPDLYCVLFVNYLIN